MVGERHPDALGLTAAPHVAEAPAEDRAARRRALGGQPALTPLAPAARDRERHDHAVAAREALDARPRLLHRAHELVAHDGAGLDERPTAAPMVLVEVGAADGARRDPQDDVGGIDEPGLGDVLRPHVAHAVEGDRVHGCLLSACAIS